MARANKTKLINHSFLFKKQNSGRPRYWTLPPELRANPVLSLPAWEWCCFCSEITVLFVLTLGRDTETKTKLYLGNKTSSYTTKGLDNRTVVKELLDLFKADFSCRLMGNIVQSVLHRIWYITLFPNRPLWFSHLVWSLDFRKEH